VIKLITPSKMTHIDIDDVRRVLPYYVGASVMCRVTLNFCDPAVSFIAQLDSITCGFTQLTFVDAKGLQLTVATSQIDELQFFARRPRSVAAS
jgi:hypothetical protein